MVLNLTRLRKSGWQPGQSGNPSGKARQQSLVELCKANTEEAVKTLIVAMRFKGPQQVPAAIAILDRGWGKPTQRIESEGGDSVHLHLLAALAVQPLEAPRQADEPQQQRQPMLIDGSVPTE